MMRELRKHLALVVAVQIVIGLVIYFSIPDWSNKSAFGSMFGVVSALYAGFTFVAVYSTLKRAFRKELDDYLRIALSVRSLDRKTAFAKVIIKNQSDMPKQIENAILLITPEEESIGDSWKILRKRHPAVRCIKKTNDIADVRIEEPLYDYEGRRALVPLPFFYNENVRVADERISYTAVINTTDMNQGSGVYSVRLFVSDTGRLHRTTHDAFKVGV